MVTTELIFRSNQCVLKIQSKGDFIMGWTFESNYEGYTPKQFWINKYIPEIESYGKYTVIAQNAKGKDFYAAVKNKETNHVFGLVVLIERHGNEIGYKEIYEESGPYYFNATKKVIEALSPTDSKYAIEWRRKCLSKFKS